MSLYIPNWIYAFSVLYSVTNPCVRMTCDFMCLLNPTGASCTCPEGKTLVNGSCIDPIVSGLKPHFTVGLLTFFMVLGVQKNMKIQWKIYIYSVNLFQYCKGDLCRPACENGGHCMVNEKGDWRCYCWPNFSGERCEVNHCTDYCLNGGTCTGSPLGKKLSNSFVSFL